MSQPAPCKKKGDSLTSMTSSMVTNCEKTRTLCLRASSRSRTITLPTRVNELLIHDVTMHAWPFERYGVRADVAQLHHNVLQAHVVNIVVGLFHCFLAGRDAEQR
jgi:hypothetical protein